ncbi:MAG: hypothetical protein ACPHCN_12705 [Mycobacterium sp.]
MSGQPFPLPPAQPTEPTKPGADDETVDDLEPIESEPAPAPVLTDEDVLAAMDELASEVAAVKAQQRSDSAPSETAVLAAEANVAAERQARFQAESERDDSEAARATFRGTVLQRITEIRRALREDSNG